MICLSKMRPTKIHQTIFHHTDSTSELVRLQRRIIAQMTRTCEVCEPRAAGEEAADARRRERAVVRREATIPG